MLLLGFYDRLEDRVCTLETSCYFCIVILLPTPLFLLPARPACPSCLPTSSVSPLSPVKSNFIYELFYTFLVSFLFYYEWRSLFVWVGFVTIGFVGVIFIFIMLLVWLSLSLLLLSLLSLIVVLCMILFNCIILLIYTILPLFS